MKLPFAVWVTCGTVGGALAAMGITLGGRTRLIVVAVGVALLVVWGVSGIRGSSPRVRSDSRRLRRLARMRRLHPPPMSDEDSRAYRALHRIRSRRTRVGPRWMRYPVARRYELPRSHDD